MCAEYVLHGPPFGSGRPMGRVLHMFGMGCPMVATTLGRVLHAFGMGRVLNMFGMGLPMAAAALLGVC